MHSLGIDIGKTTMHVCLLTDDGKALRRKLDAGETGRVALIEWIEKKVGEPVHACMEATGGWEEAIATLLHEHGHTVSVVNPRRIKAYGDSEGARSKTDHADAGLIARFCRTQCPTQWHPPTEAERTLTDLVRRCADLEQMRCAEQNRLASPLRSSIVRDSLERSVTELNEQIAALTDDIRNHIDRNDELKGRRDLITSIPGIADATAEIILGELGDIMRFQSAQQLAAFCGITPCEWTSGTSVRRRPSISKRGNARLRAALFYPAMSAMQCNPVIHAFSERLRSAGKTGRQIVVAAMRKLLHLVYGVIKHQMPFNPAWTLDS